MLLQKPSEVASVLKFKNRRDAYNVFVEGFSKLLEMDMTPFKAWLSHHKNDLQLLFAETVDSVWDNFVYSEEKAAVELEQASVAKRLAKLKRLSKKDALEKSTVAKYREKTAEWLKDVQENEYLRYRRFAQDALDTQVFVAEEWATTSADIRRELGLWDPWANSQGRPVNQQQLDFVEGPLRMRRKLRRSRHTADLDILSRSPSGDIRASPASTPVPESPAFVQARPESRQSAVVSSSALDPLAEELEVSTAQSETGTGDGAEELEQGEEEGVLQDEDKNRKIARLLEAGDTVLESFNAARVTGLDICEGLMLICRDNIYLIDNYTRRSDGELDDIDNVPEEERNGYNLILSASASPPEAGRPRHACRKWAYDNIKEVHKRKFLFRNVGLEIFLLDGRNFLVTLEPSDRDMVYNRLLSKASTAAANRNETMVDTDGLSVGGKITSILFSGGSSLSELTAKWERWEISNFEYLMRLNTLAGRSYNDLTQFPVFPWVVADYTSAELDLTSRATFRDLAKPMGAQTAERAEEFEDRFKSWEDPEGRPAFHYGTHYSSSMIVCSFLIRMEPFTQQFLKLQGGHLDHADRLFHSLEHAWLSASKLNTTDVRELVPEFYCNPEFLRNANMYDFGIRQSGERINDVVLPPWARGDPRFFVSKLRQALESNYVSQHLHEWIDLIFGVKQSGAEAAKALNVFHHLSYEGAVDMDAISDPVEKQATIGIIHNFGQTPRQLFRKAHPPRMLFCPVVAYKIYRQPQLLFQAPKILAQINQPVHVIWVTNDHIAAIGPCRAIVPMRTGQAPSRFLEWGYVDASVRVYQLDTGKLAGVFESLHTGQITCAGFADDKTFVLAGTDMVITVWRFGQDRQLSVELMQVLRGHQSAVTCLAVSRAYNLIISGAAQDNHALVWDLNRLIFVRRLLHPEPVRIALVNEVTGDILLASELYLSVFTVNGELLACRQAAFLAQDAVLSAAFFTGDGWADADVVVSGHRSGAIKIWKLRLTETISSKETEVKSRWNWTLELAATLQPRSEPRPCTALYVAASQRYLLGGDNVGRVTAWLMPEGSGTEMHFSSAAEATSCTSCRRGIGGMAILVDKRFNCTACGSIFCADCVGPLPLFSGRFCISCAERAQGSRPEL